MLPDPEDDATDAKDDDDVDAAENGNAVKKKTNYHPLPQPFCTLHHLKKKPKRHFF